MPRKPCSSQVPKFEPNKGEPSRVELNKHEPSEGVDNVDLIEGSIVKPLFKTATFADENRDAFSTSVIPLPQRHSKSKEYSVQWKEILDPTPADMLNGEKDVQNFHRKRTEEVDNEFTQARKASVVDNVMDGGFQPANILRRGLSEDVYKLGNDQFHVKVSKLD